MLPMKWGRVFVVCSAQKAELALNSDAMMFPFRCDYVKGDVWQVTWFESRRALQAFVGALHSMNADFELVTRSKALRYLGV